jgi:hypothetical protein
MTVTQDTSLPPLGGRASQWLNPSNQEDTVGEIDFESLFSLQRERRTVDPAGMQASS